MTFLKVIDGLSSCNFDERKSLYRDMEGRFRANASFRAFSRSVVRFAFWLTANANY